MIDGGNAVRSMVSSDEMNVFIPQSLQTQLELEEIACVEKQIITPTTSKTIVGIVQDGLVGAYNLTSPTLRIDWRNAMNIMSYTSLEDFSTIKKNSEFTGAELYSLIIPSGINVNRETLKIKNGKLIEGRLSKEMLGANKKNNMVQLIWDGYGVNETKNFIDNTQRLVNNFNLWHGFTVGIGDVDVPKEIHDQIDTMFATKELKLEQIITEMENNPEYMQQDLFEHKLFSEMDIVRSDVSKLIMENLSKTNNINIMAMSGSKGDAINMGQMAGCAGLQAFEGKIIPKKYNGRTLAYFHQNDDRITSRGLVRQSFIEGLQFPEFVFHLMASRAGIIEQAIKSVTGDTQVLIQMRSKNALFPSWTKIVRIGDWIDDKFKWIKGPSKPQGKFRMECMNVEYKDCEYYVPTMDLDGNVSWGKITAVTRHDHDNDLYEYKTRSGRSVKVVQSKSLLTWNNDLGQFERKLTKDVRIGDFVPVTKYLPSPPELNISNGLITEDNFDQMTDVSVNKIKLFLKNMFESEIECDSQTNLEYLLTLFNRIGTFGVISGNSLIIDKSENYHAHSDVVLDEIISIEKVDDSLYNKVYDITVPKTINFCLANGLHVVDTAETGYTQRKLIKSMEDIMIKYDGTVRNANDGLVQLIYGDSGADTTKQYEYTIKLIQMNNDELKNKHKFTSQELKNYKGFTEKDNDELINEMMLLRDTVRHAVRSAKLNYIVLVDKFMLPINLNRIIDTITAKEDVKSNDELSPKYIVDKLNWILKNENTTILCMSNAERNDLNSFKNRDEIAHKTILKTALFDALSPKKVLLDLNLNKKQFDTIIDEILYNFGKNMIEPGEMAGVISGQSMGEPLTQMTLNSVDWKEKILIRNFKTKCTKIIEIGYFIDELLKNNNNVQHLGDNKETEMGDTYYLDTKDNDYYIPAVTTNGIVEWKKIEAITKHLPMNKDGTNTLLKIKTRLGREVCATKAKSFLTRINNEIVPIRGDDLKVGTYLPVMKDFPQMEFDDYYDTTIHFPKTQFVYGSEIKKANQIKLNSNAYGSRLWFKNYNGVEYTVPYSRQDSLKHVLDGHTKQEFKTGYIYPKKCKNVTSLIPEKIKLDKTFGFIVGAYIAEGCCTSTYIAITNNDKKYRKNVEKFAKQYNIGFHEVCSNKQLSNKPQYDIRLHSTLFAKLMKELCGQLSHNKIIPDFAFTANNEFISGLLNGYFSGDGTISLKDGSISASSVSEKLITQLSMLLTRIGIVSKTSQNSKVHKNNIGTTSDNIKQVYTLTIRNDNTKKFYDNVQLCIDNKQIRLENTNKKQRTCGFGLYDKIPGITMKSIKLIEHLYERSSDETIAEYESGIIHRNKLEYLLKNYKDQMSSDEIKIVNEILNSNVYYDQIISIDEVQPTHKYVYDFTVEDTKNFGLANTLLVNDSFHHSGIASMSATVQGAPRIKELLSVSKKPKTPQMVIYLTDEFMTSKEMAHKIASHVKFTTLGDIRGKIYVYYDPNPKEKTGFMEQDNVKHTFYHHKGARTNCQSDITGLPFLMRVEIDREKMLEKEVTLLEIKSKFCSWWEKRFAEAKSMKKEEKKVINKITQLAVLSNSDNDKQPVIHIRFNVKDTEKEKDKFDFNTFDNFIDHIIDKFKLKGINSVTDIPAIQDERIMTFNKETGSVDKNTQYVIYTSGVNLEEIRYFVGIDIDRTVSNHVMDVYDTFGIEIARATLLREIFNAFERAGKEVNYQHVTIIVDQMTGSGTINSVDRHGMNKSDNDPLARASFEKTVEQLLTAAVYGETDHMKSVSSRIMAGAVIKGGTGYCELELDTEMIENSEYIEGIDFTKKFTELNTGTLAGDIIQKGNDDIFIPM